MRIVGCHLGRDGEADREATEHYPQQIEQGGLASGISRNAHHIQITVNWANRIANTRSHLIALTFV